MNKWAFIVGCDYEDLECARNDAEQLAIGLHLHGFRFPDFRPDNFKNKEIDFSKVENVIKYGLPGKFTTASEVREKLFELADQSDENDIVFFYFAGHAIKDSNSLKLLLDTSQTI